MPEHRLRVDALANEVAEEVHRAHRLHPRPFNSPHEGFAIIMEEVDELKAHVWMKQKDRSLRDMRKEAIEVAAMALRFALEVCDEEVGRR